MNATAYRIFKLLAWLMQEPLSVNDLNQRFLDDPLTKKSLSNDSVWLYINTLKALGCHIRRPCPSNQFRYELHYHPFALTLSEIQLETLAQVKAYAQQRFDHREMLALDRLLKKMVRYCAYEEPEEVIERLFEQSRSLDYETSQQHIDFIEQWVLDEQLLHLSYLSPLRGRQTFYFLPETLFYQQGVLYIRGDRPDFEEPSSLRADRIVAVKAVEKEDVRQVLLARRACLTEVVIHLMAPKPEAFDGFALEAAQGVYGQQCRWIQTEGQKACYEVRLQLRDTFYLKQQLLSCGFAFQIQGADQFRQDMRQTLQAMRQYYQDVSAPARRDSHERG